MTFGAGANPWRSVSTVSSFLADPCLRVPVSPRPRVPASPCPRVPASPRLRVSVSPCLRVPASPRPRVPASPRLRVPVSPRPRVPASPCLRVPASPRPRVPASPRLRVQVRHLQQPVILVRKVRYRLVRVEALESLITRHERAIPSVGGLKRPVWHVNEVALHFPHIPLRETPVIVP